MSTRRMFFSAVALTVSFAHPSVEAQMQTYSSAPWHGVSSGFYERIGVRWGFRQRTPGGYFFFNNGGPGPLPPFGGFDPGAQASIAAGGRSGNLSWNFGVFASQGSSLSFGSQTPSIVLPNGGTGFFYDSVQRPFVMGIVPIVGAQPMSPLRERLMRLQYQRLLDNGANGEKAESTDATDEPLMASEPPAPSRNDDPPLVLGKD